MRPPHLLHHLTLLAGLLLTLPLHAAQPSTIRIAVPDISASSQPSGGGVVDVLREQGILEAEFGKDGIEIQWLFFKGAGPAVNEALANGQADLAYLGDLPAIIGKSSGLDTRVLSAFTRGIKSYLGVVPGSGIKTLADLKGKRVGIFRGTTNQLSFVTALESQGLRERDLKVINLDFNASTAALAAGQIDAAWGLANLIVLRSRGLAELPLSSADLGGAGDSAGVLVGHGTFIDKHPQLISRYLQAQQQAVEWLISDQHDLDYIDLLARLAGYPADVLKADLENTRFSHLFNPRLDDEFIANLQHSADLAYRERLIRRPVEVKEWVQPSFINAVWAAREKSAE